MGKSPVEPSPLSIALSSRSWKLNTECWNTSVAGCTLAVCCLFRSTFYTGIFVCYCSYPYKVVPIIQYLNSIWLHVNVPVLSENMYSTYPNSSFIVVV